MIFCCCASYQPCRCFLSFQLKDVAVKRGGFANGSIRKQGSSQFLFVVNVFLAKFNIMNSISVVMNNKIQHINKTL